MQTYIGSHELALVSPNNFVERMERRWTEGFGMPASDPLRTLWGAMGNAFNQSIIEKASGHPPKTRVLQFPMGSGKTQGDAVFAALQAETNAAAEDSTKQVGLLIVTRLTQQVEDLVKDINTEAGRDVAIGDYAGHRATPDELHNADILVITHAAYEKATTTLSEVKGRRWEMLMTWKGGPRLLTIVDEALANVVSESKLALDRLSHTIGVIPIQMRRTYPKEVEALEWLRERLMHHDGINAVLGPQPHFAWFKGETPEAIDFSDFRVEMRRQAYDQLDGKNDAHERARLASRHDAVIETAEALLDQFAYFHLKGNQPTFNSSAVAIPLETLGPVIQDATAGRDLVYTLMRHEPQIICAPEGVRDYGNVTLHVARASGVGKTKMIERAKTRVPNLITDLKERLGPERAVLFCVHQKVEPFFPEPEDMPFKEWKKLHWGAIDGSNEAKDYDTAVILGLPYRDPDTFVPNMLFALRGVHSDWFDVPHAYWNGHDNLRQTMLNRGVSVSVLQAMGRIRLRKIINEQGQCAPCDVYVVLPEGKNGDAVIDHIRKELPGIQVAAWPFDLDGPKVRLEHTATPHQRLLDFMATRDPGSTSLTTISRTLGLRRDATKDLQKALRNENHKTTLKLKAMGCTYVGGRSGPRGGSYIVKAAG